MHKILKDISAMCQRCKKEEGTFIHMFWDCSLLKHFWDSIHTFAELVLNRQFKLKSSLYLLNDTKHLLLDQSKRRIFILITYFAKKCVLLLWKNEIPPSFKTFADLLSSFFTLRKNDLREI